MVLFTPPTIHLNNWRSNIQMTHSKHFCQRHKNPSSENSDKIAEMSQLYDVFILYASLHLPAINGDVHCSIKRARARIAAFETIEHVIMHHILEFIYRIAQFSRVSVSVYMTNSWHVLINAVCNMSCHLRTVTFFRWHKIMHKLIFVHVSFCRL
jgi:hypothetical protein